MEMARGGRGARGGAIYTFSLMRPLVFPPPLPTKDLPEHVRRAMRAFARVHKMLKAKEAARRGGVHDAAVMQIRCDLAQGIRQWLKKRHLSQAQGAEILGISAPRINEIVKNRVEQVSVDDLLVLCAKAGISVSVKLAA